MSDSSSGESSDDDILNMPVFKKRDRRTERASKSKLSFLDACLDGTNQRTDAQRRLANVESEHMLETEKQEDNVEEREEEMTPQAQAGVAADEAKGTEVTQHEADNDSNCSEKRKKVVTMAAPKAERAPSMHHNEEVYWDRVESFNSTNKTKMNAGIDADRGKLSDAMNGLDYNSETDDEDGKWNDGNGGMTREQLRSEARAKLQGLSAAVGTRRMFQHTTSTTTTSKACVYDSKLEATNELKLIVSTLQKRYRNETEESKQFLRYQLLDPLNKIFKKPKELIWGMLLRFLQQNVLVNGTCEERVILPKPICIWMWNVACSSYEAMGHVATACRQNLVKMLVNEMDIDDGTFSADLSFMEQLSINDFISSLENECGLWLNAGPAPSDDGRNNNDNTASPLDVYALKNRFLLWKAAFERDLINLDMNDGDSKLFQEATNAVTALTRIGIDPTFSLANENINFCISTLPSIVQSLSAALVNSTIRQMSKLQSQPDTKKWIERTADRMVEACSNLKAGDEGTADQDDEDGWLPLACAAERMIDFEGEELSLDVIEMKLNFITLALSRCLMEDSVGDRENQLKEATTRFKDLVIEDDSNDTTKQRLLQTAMHALVNAAINLRCVEKRAGSFQKSKDHPLYLASILLSGECAFVGLHLSKQILKNNLQLQTEEKDALVESMSIIETTCNNMKKKCVSVIAYPHLRRIKEYLTRLGKALSAMKGKSSTDKRRKTRTQGSLDGWRRSSLPPSEDTQDKSLFEFSQDSNCSSQSIFLESQD